MKRAERQGVIAACKEKGHKWQHEGTYSKCQRCGKTKRKPSPIKLQQVIPDTGEIIEQTVSEKHFKPERPDYISAKFRERVLAGDRPGLVFSGEEDCPLEVGQEFPLTSNVSILVNRITKTKGGDHRCRYAVIDMRATLPRRTPPMFEPPETDEFGYPIKPTPGAIAAATIDGNYCQGNSQAVPDVGEEVGIEYQRVLGTKSRAKTIARNKEEQPVEEAGKDLERLNSETKELAKRAIKMGLDPTIALAPVARALKEAHAGLAPDSEDALKPSAGVV